MSLPGSLLPLVTAITASNDGGEVCAHAADGNNGSTWIASASTGWLRYQLSASRVVITYAVTSSVNFANQDPANWQFQGSPDGSTWTTLDTQTGQTFATRTLTKTYTVANSTGYLYYRFNITANGGSAITSVAEFDIAATPPAASPTLPVTTGAVIDLRADSIAVFDGSTVSAWSDQSGAANNLICTGNMVFKPAQTPTAGPVVRFTTTGKGTFANNAMFNAATASEIFLVVRTAAGNGNGHYQFGSNDWTFYAFSDGNCYDGAFTNTRFSWAGVSVTSWHIYNVTSDGTTWTARIDGTVVKTAAAAYRAPNLATKSTMTLGYSATGWSGDLAEVVAFSRALTTAERSDVYAYLSDAHIHHIVTVSAPPFDVTAAVPLPVTVDAPPIDTLTSLGVSAFVEAPPIEAEASLQTGTLGRAISVPGVDVDARPMPPQLLRIQRILLQPERGAVVPVSRPLFAVDVTVLDGDVDTLTVDVEYADNEDFTSAEMVSVDVALIDGVNTVRLLADTDIPDLTPYWWRARTVVGDTVFPWTADRPFTVSAATVGDGSIPLHGSLTAGPTEPTLWYVTPTYGGPGDEVTVVGQGFSLAEGTVSVAGVALQVQSWTCNIPASADADTDDRLIDSADDITDCEHDQVIVLVTDTIPTGGGQLVVADGS